LVLVENATVSVTSADILIGYRSGSAMGTGSARSGAAWPKSPVRAVLVVERLELVQRVQQVALIPGQSAIQQLAPAGLYPSLYHGVHPRHPDAAEHGFQTGVLEHGVEQAGELAVAVPHQEPRPAAGILKIHDEVLRNLRYPECCRVRGSAQDPDPPAACSMTTSTYRRLRKIVSTVEEIARQQALGLDVQETFARRCPGRAERDGSAGGVFGDVQRERLSVVCHH
jgi:hypothetical protein